MHTGINTGLVVARRSDARAGDYALTGDTVNTAARLRSLAGAGRSARQRRHLAAGVRPLRGRALRRRSRSRARSGRSSPTASAASGRRRPGRRPAGRPGRGAARLRAPSPRPAPSGSAAASSSSAAIPGVGKSRLVAEFVASARDARLFLPRAPRCSTSARRPAGTRSAAWRAACSASPARPTRPRAAQAIERAAADPADRRRPPALPLRPARRRAAGRAARARRGDEHARPASRARCTPCASWRAARRASAPLLLLVEDIHWADAWTLERLAALALLAARQPLLLVMTTRFAGDPTAGAWRTVAARRAAARHRPRPADRRGRAPAGRCARRRCRPRWSPAASSAPKATRSSCCSSCSTPARRRSRACRARSRRSSTRAWTGSRATTRSALQAAAVLGQRFALEALRHLLEQPGYDCRAAGRELPRPPRRQRAHVLPRADPRRRLRIAAAQAAARACTPAPPSGSRRATPCSPPSTSTAPRIRAPPRPTWRPAQRVAAQFRHGAALALVERGLALAADAGARFALLMARGRLLLELGRSAEAIEACRAALEAAANAGERRGR